MKTKICIILAIFIVLGAISTFWYIDYKKTEDAYTQAIEHIKQDEFDLAIAKLNTANKEKIDKDDFYYEYMYDRSSSSYYKDSAILYAYSLAKAEYNKGNKSMGYIDRYLEIIPDNYNRTLSDEINAFKDNFEPEYEEYLLEQARKREIEENERIRNSVPYVGMSESKINDTILGTNYEIVHNSEYIKGENIRANIYRFKRGNGIIFVARCLQGKVVKVIDYRDDPWVLPSTSSSSAKKKSNDDDPYDVNEYSTPEDFYDEYYDDFWDYEEAEDYYNSYHEDP